MVEMGSSDGCGAASVTYYQQQQHRQQAHHQAGQQSRRGVMQRLERWVFLYNVTTGLYMLDWWERCIVNAIFLVFFFVACYNSGHYLCRLGAGLVAWCGDDAADSFALG